MLLQNSIEELKSLLNQKGENKVLCLLVYPKHVIAVILLVI